MSGLLSEDNRVLIADTRTLCIVKCSYNAEQRGPRKRCRMILMAANISTERFTHYLSSAARTDAQNRALVLRFNVSILATAFYPRLPRVMPSESLTAIIEILRSQCIMQALRCCIYLPEDMFFANIVP